MSYSHMGTPTLPSALTRFTSEFGMGSGGAMSLLSLDKKGTILKAVSSRRCLSDDKYVLFSLIHTMLMRDVLFLHLPLGNFCQTSYNPLHSSLHQQNHLGVVWLSLTGN